MPSVTIPESVTSIGGWAFFDCSGLTSVLCKSKKPASCDGSVFSSLESRLIIPVGSEEAYASAKEWKEFTNHYVFKTFDHAVTTFADAEKIDLDKAYQVGDEKTLAAAVTKDLKVYQFTGSAVNGTIYGTEVKGIVPAGTGLLMTGTEGATYVFPLASGDATADVSGNKLVGVTIDTDLSTLTDGDSHYVYDNDAFRLQSTGTIAANEAYLSLPTSGTDKINVTLGGVSTGIKGIAADNEKGSFQMLGADYAQASGEWTRIEVSLPEGTTYFAIRQNTPSSQAFLFMLDDITFEMASQASNYRVYRGGSLVGATSATTYQDQGLEEGDYQYAVTAVYPDGSESAPALLTVSTQIPQTGMAKAPAYDVYSITGALVRRNASRLDGLPKGVYIVDGRKVVVK